MDSRNTNGLALTRLFFYMLPFLFVGWLFDVFWPLTAIGLLALVFWHYYYQQKLIRWLWQSRALIPPSAPGSWADIYDGIYRSQRRSQKRRKGLTRLLKRFREAADALPDAALVFRADGTLLWSNKLAQFYFGLRWPDDAGQRVSNLIRHPEFTAYLNAATFEDALTIPSPVRDSLDIEIRIMPYSDDQLLLIARDVTQLKRLETLRRDFVADVSHELKTPLTVLQGYLEMLDEPARTPPAMLEKAVQQMSAQRIRMANLVEQLLTLSRMETSADEVFDQVVDVPALLAGLRNEAQKLNTKKQHQIEFSVAPIQVYGKESVLFSAMQNLIHNAIQYTDPGGSVQVSWSETSAGIEFRVTDNGPGIAPAHVSRLTERFYRVDSDRNSTSGGTGLGLAITKHAVEHHNAQLNIRSTLGRGSCFSFVLPSGLRAE